VRADFLSFENVNSKPIPRPFVRDFLMQMGARWWRCFYISPLAIHPLHSPRVSVWPSVALLASRQMLLRTVHVAPCTVVGCVVCWSHTLSGAQALAPLEQILRWDGIEAAYRCLCVVVRYTVLNSRRVVRAPRQTVSNLERQAAHAAPD